MALTKITNSAIADDIGLGGNPTTSTQTAGDSTTRIATTAFVSTAVANLVDSAPATLNTLNELAAAIGDNATFSSTMTTSIASKLPLAGGTLTGNLNLGDNVRARFGLDSDLQIYHDGSNSIISDEGTGELRLRGSSYVKIMDTNDEVGLQFRTNGAVTLYHNNIAKFETTSTGISISNDANFPDNGKAIFGAGDDLQIYHDPNHSIINESGTGSLKIQGDNIRLQKTDGSENMITAVNDGAVTLFNNGSAKIATTATGADITGILTADGLTVNSGTANVVATFQSTDVNALIKFEDNDTTTETSLGAKDNDMVFRVGADEAMRIDPSQNVFVPNGTFVVNNTAGGFLKLESTDSSLSANQVVGELQFYANDASTNSTGNKAFIKAYSETSGGNSIGLDLATSNGSSATGLPRLNIASNGDISFYEDTGSTPKFFWDASTERLGLGTTVPAYPLDVASSNATSIAYQRTGVSAKKWAFNSDNSNTYWANETDNILAMTLSNAGNASFSGAVTSTGLTVNGNLATVGVGGSSAQLTEIRLDATSNSGYGGFIRGRKGGSSQWLFGDTASALGSGTGLINYVYGDNPTSFYNNGQLALNINGSQNVNIPNGGLMVGATTAPTTKFELNSGGANSVYQTFTRSTGGTNEKYWQMGIGTNHRFSIGRQVDANNSLSEYLSIDSSGRVGIGEVDPDNKLDVNFSITGEGSQEGGIKIHNVRGSNNDIAPLYFGVHGGTRRTKAAIGLKREGSYGIGSLIFALDSNGDDANVTFANDEKMRISSAGNVHLNTGVDARVQLGTSGTGATSVSDNSVYVRGNDDDLILGAAGNGNISFKENADTRMFIKTGGNVGIGTTSPTSKLEVIVTQSDTMTDDTAAFAIKGNGGDGILMGQRATTPYAAWIAAGYLPNIGTSHNYPLTLQPHGGNVGIGTSSPSELLEVRKDSGNAIIKVQTGGGHDARLILDAPAASGAQSQIFFDASGTTAGSIQYTHNSGGTNFMTFHTGGSNVESMRIDSVGSVGIGCTPSAWAFSKALQLGDGASLATGGNQNMWLSANLYLASDATFKYITNNRASQINLYNGGVTFSRVASGTAGATATLQESGRFDNSGNFLVGTTNTTWQTQEGLRYFNGSSLIVTRDSDEPLNLNRLSNAGDIAVFKKDGTTAGLVGVKSDTSNPYMVIGKGSVALQFASDTDAVSVLPARADNLSLTNGAMDIGSSTQRFRDLYLSGQISTNTATGLSITADSSNRGILNLSTSQAYQLIGGTHYGYTGYKTGGYHRWFGSDGSEDMRIDSSGNLLVGTTSNSVYNDASGTGIALNAGQIQIAGTGAPLYLNRQGSDGTIAEFRKSGTTTVGSIGVTTAELGIGGGDANLLFMPSDNAIAPSSTSSGGASDGVLDLGRSARRFKDLYLSSGVYLGGTGAANKLDDYEEGTWTPAIVGATSASGQQYTSRAGSYVKIGRSVTVNFSMVLSAKGSMAGSVKIIGLPFNGISGRAQTGSIMAGYVDLDDNQQLVGYQYAVNPLIYLFYQENDTGLVQLNGAGALNNNTEIQGSFTYFTDS